MRIQARPRPPCGCPVALIVGLTPTVGRASCRHPDFLAMAQRRPLPDAAIPDPEARAMRPSVFLLPLLWLVACAAQADTPKPQLSAQQCGIRAANKT